jgi:hypothetical protein
LKKNNEGKTCAGKQNKDTVLNGTVIQGKCMRAIFGYTYGTKKSTQTACICVE